MTAVVFQMHANETGVIHRRRQAGTERSGVATCGCLRELVLCAREFLPNPPNRRDPSLACSCCYSKRPGWIWWIFGHWLRVIKHGALYAMRVAIQYESCRSVWIRCAATVNQSGFGIPSLLIETTAGHAVAVAKRFSLSGSRTETHTPPTDLVRINPRPDICPPQCGLLHPLKSPSWISAPGKDKGLKLWG